MNDIQGVALCGEHDDWHATLSANAAAHLDAVLAGQHQVKQHQVGLAFLEYGQCR